jgi:hypothetical protein
LFPQDLNRHCQHSLANALGNLWPKRMKNVIRGQCAWEFYDLEDPQHYKSVYVDADGNEEVIMELKSKFSL